MNEKLRPDLGVVSDGDKIAITQKRESSRSASGTKRHTVSMTLDEAKWIRKQLGRYIAQYEAMRKRGLE